jgi:tRNA A-37 threonylcarbamoyl transferase component Bud32
MKLIFLEGPEEGNQYQVDRSITMGRDVSNDIPVTDPSVSLVHCKIYVEGNNVMLQDQGSTNGVEVNGKRVISSPLVDGDCMKIGKNVLRIEIAEEEIKEIMKTTREPAGSVTIFEEDKGEEDVAEIVDQERAKELSGNIFGEVTYFLKRKIADGGMGSVYEAEQFGAEGFIKKIAIKTILPAYVKKESFVTSFIGEARLVANLVHQNIVQIHHLGRHEDGYYIAMEYIDGVNLMDFMMRHDKLRKDVPIDIATFIVSRICRGLEYAHSKCDDQGRPLHLVHRDVSPNNIMITREGEVKLTDFGVARAAQFMEDDDVYLVGSVEYMAPEQADCGEIDGRSDLYGLALIYYELLTGIRVFLCKDGDVHETVERVIEGEVPDPLQYRSDLPESIAEMVMKCLAKDPDNRFQSAGDMSYALERSMYSEGYGPTIVRLSEYMKEIELS